VTGPVAADEERRLSARLQTLIGAGRGAPELASLRAEAAARMGPDHEITLAVEHALEVSLDAARTPEKSLPVWLALRERAARSLPPRSATAVAIRARHRRQLHDCGRPDDLDLLVELCRRETDPDAGTDLAGALRDRARFGGHGDDLGAALALTEREAARRGADHVAVAAVRRIRVDVLLALGRADAALTLAGELASGDDADAGAGDGWPGPRVLLAEALLMAGRIAEAGRVARLAYALCPGAFDPARPLLVVARTEPTPAARATARAALRERQAFFPPESHYVAEARRLVEELAC
jgi:hypothetical protein